MLLTNLHTHSTFSFDGKNTIEEMLDEAIRCGISVLGTSEHFNYDYIVEKVVYHGGGIDTGIDKEGYFCSARDIQKRYKNKIRYLVGAEFGFSEREELAPMYKSVVESFHPDYIINSVHTQGKLEYSERLPAFCKNNVYTCDDDILDKQTVYGNYLKRVLKSIDAPYPYDIIGHFTYCSRFSPYEDWRFYYKDFSDLIDEILKKIIQKGKILEVNSSFKREENGFMPTYEILKRYYDLGGRLISFGTDAHDKTRLLDKRQVVVDALKKIGFSSITVPDNGIYGQIEI